MENFDVCRSVFCSRLAYRSGCGNYLLSCDAADCNWLGIALRVYSVADLSVEKKLVVNVHGYSYLSLPKCQKCYFLSAV